MLDANVIVQYLVEEDEAQFVVASEIIENKKCFVTVQILCEVVYILEKRYNVSREDIYISLVGLSRIVDYESGDIYMAALSAYVDKPKLDISDCLLYAYNLLYGIPVFTFDKKLNKKIDRVNSTNDEE